MTSCRTYSPYGAWELKRTYQRNLLLANVSVILLVGLAIAIPSVFGGKEIVVPDRIVPPKDGDMSGPIDWNTDPIVIVPDGGRGPAPVKLDGGIPVPVPDDPAFEDDVAIPTPANRAVGSVPSDYVDSTVESGGGGGIGPAVTIGKEVPEPGEYVYVDQPPEMIHEVTPAYPRLAKQAGIEGTVWIQALVDIDGAVREVRVGKSSETTALDDAAVAAAWKNRYTPAIRASQPVLVWVTYRVDFRLE